MVPFDVQWIDVTNNLVGGVQPTFMLRRPKAHNQAKAWAGSTQVAHLGEFWVPTTSVLVEDEQQHWAVTRIEEFVRIPIVAYKIPRQLASIWGLGLQIGMAAMMGLRNHTADVPQAVTLVLGHECTDLTPLEDAFRCYVGVAIRTK